MGQQDKMISENVKFYERWYADESTSTGTLQSKSFEQLINDYSIIKWNSDM